jgi:CheY-like chemotaxis protein
MVKKVKNNLQKNKTILVVDDDTGILEAFKAMLEVTPYTITTSSDADFLQTLNTDNLPDLILLDVLLSGRDGRDVCRELKANVQTKHIPIVMISAHPNAEVSVKEAGADDFLSKPFEMDELTSLIEKYLS